MNGLVVRLIEAIKAGWNSALAEIRSNPRARMGVIAIGGVLVVALGLRLVDHAAQRQSEIAALRVLEREYTVLSQPEHARTWQDADQQLTAELANARNQLWSDGPVGVAHASFFAWIQELSNTSGFQNATIRLGEARRIGTDGELTEIRVNVFVPQAPGASRDQVISFLGAIAQSPKLVYVRSLRLRFQPSILLEGEFAAFVPTDPQVTARDARGS